MRLQECFEDFLRDGSTYWAPSSYQYYKRNVDYFFNYLANRYRRPSGSMELSELPETILAEYGLAAVKGEICGPSAPGRNECKRYDQK